MHAFYTGSQGHVHSVIDEQWYIGGSRDCVEVFGDSYQVSSIGRLVAVLDNGGACLDMSNGIGVSV